MYFTILLQSIYTWLGTIEVEIEDDSTCDVDAIAEAAFEKAEFAPETTEATKEAHKDYDAWQVVGLVADESYGTDAKDILDAALTGGASEDKPIPLHKFKALDDITEAYQTDEKLGEGVAAAYCRAVGQIGSRRGVEEAYRGQFSQMADYARQYADDVMDIPDSLASYIDYKALGKDLEMDMYYDEDSGFLFDAR